MKLNARSLFDELNIPYGTEGKSSTPGWLQLTCPFCDDHKDHLGFNLTREYFHCWKCGWHPLVETMTELSGLSGWKASQAVDRHRTGRPQKINREIAERPKHIEYPQGTKKLGKVHMDYLIKRGFPPWKIEEMQRTYNLYGTGPTGIYKLRVLIPITYYGKLVSYQARDITDKASKKYLACAGKDEVRPHKECLFGADLVKGKTVVAVEGLMDSIKLGPGSVATFGVELSWAQIRQLADRWENRYIAFDSDLAGIEGARRLAATLSAMPGNTHIVSFDRVKDPDGLSISAAEDFMKSLIK